MEYPEYLPNTIEFAKNEWGFYDLLIDGEPFPYHVAPESITLGYDRFAPGIGIAYLPVLFDHEFSKAGEEEITPAGF